MCWKMEWTESGGTAVAQSKDKSALERHAGVYTGSGKLVLSMNSISEKDYEYNKSRGMKTV